MNSTKQQRRSFVNNAKKQWKKGLISKAEYESIRQQIKQLGVEKHEKMQQTLSEQKGVTKLVNQDVDIDAELMDDEDFAPTDL